MTSPTIPRIDPGSIAFLIAGAAGIVFLAVGETLGTARTFAAKYRYEVDADQELLAMGAANVSSGLFQGITIDMSLSSTASGEAAGERSQLSSLVSAAVILAVVMFLAPLLRNLPTAVLGAIVLTSILGLFNFEELRRYYRQRRTDFVLALTALAGVVATDVMTGLMLAVLLSLVMLLYRASRPYIAILGKRASGEYGDTGRHADAQPVPGLVILRLDAPLYFFNASVARTQILAELSSRAVDHRRSCWILGPAPISTSARPICCAIWPEIFARRNIDLLFAQVRGSVRQRMRKSRACSTRSAKTISSPASPQPLALSKLARSLRATSSKGQRK